MGMGKYIVTVSGVDRKSELISESFHLSEMSSEIKEACKGVFEDNWKMYQVHDIEIDVVDLERAIREFQPSYLDMGRIQDFIKERKQENDEQEERDLQEYARLQTKYGGVK